MCIMLCLVYIVLTILYHNYSQNVDYLYSSYLTQRTLTLVSGLYGVSAPDRVEVVSDSERECVVQTTVSLNNKSATHKTAILNLSFKVCVLRIDVCVVMVVTFICSFPRSGLQHVGCYFVPPRSQFIGLLEGSTEDLSDDPVTRTNPIRKCGSAAQQRRFTYFAISVGYCISGSNRLSDYQYVRSNLCQNGVGNYYRGYFLMDIYQIVNQGTFADSLVAEPFTTELPTNATDFNEISSAPVISSSSLLLIVSIFMTLIPTLLLN